jgi:hypothetical protein
MRCLSPSRRASGDSAGPPLRGTASLGFIPVPPRGTPSAPARRDQPPKGTGTGSPRRERRRSASV